MDRTARERLFKTILGELTERGYGGLVLADALSSAGIARAAFDAEFEDVDACLLAAYDTLTARLIGRADAAARECGDDWPGQVRASLEALLGELAADPTMATALVRSFPAIRPTARLRYVEFLETFTHCLRGGRDLSAAAGEPPVELEMLAIDAAAEVISAEVGAGRATELPKMTTTIHFSLLAPFLGAERALAEAQR